MNSAHRLADKVAVITGATSGIGRAAARRFGREGARVVVAGRDERSGSEVVDEIVAGGGEALWVRADVTSAHDMQALIAAAEARFGRVDVLYANAGVLERGTATDTPEEQWQRVIDVNLGGQFRLAKYGIPALERAGGGSMILTASELGLVGARDMVAYCAAKGGVVNMVRALAVDCAPLGIRINALAPGAVQTPMLERWFAEEPEPEAAVTRQVGPIPLGRLGQAEEVAAVAVFLASDEATYVTGSVYLVDGGVTASYGL